MESAFEFADICRDHDYHNFLFSMKASNPLVMVQAYRLLAEEMYAKGWDYPLHLGVTEVRYTGPFVSPMAPVTALPDPASGYTPLTIASVALCKPCCKHWCSPLNGCQMLAGSDCFT